MKKSVAPESSGDPALIRDAEVKAKSMIGVGRKGRPFLDYLLFNARQAGYGDVLIVGLSTPGNTLTITNGGAVYDNNGAIGYNAGSTSNTVLVTGAGSVWSNSGNM